MAATTENHVWGNEVRQRPYPAHRLLRRLQMRAFGRSQLWALARPRPALRSRTEVHLPGMRPPRRRCQAAVSASDDGNRHWLKELIPRSRYRRQKHREKTLLSGWRPWCALHRGRFNCRLRFRGLLSCVFGMASSGAQNYRGAIIACACIHGVTNSQIVERLPDVG